MQKLINVYKLNRIDYSKCLKIQKYLVKKQLDSLQTGSKTDETPLDSLLLLEHNPVYTIGIRRQNYSSEYLESLRKLNASVEITDRGGLITFHGPGQLVAYPIINLKKYQPSLKWYVNQLEQVVINLCKKEFNLEAYRKCDIGYTGVWSNETKIAAIGVHSKRYITYHGVSLNCNTDLKWFDHIVPCGIEDKRVSSLDELVRKRGPVQGQQMSVDLVTPLFLKAFAAQFDCKLILQHQSEVDGLVERANSS
jgi:lipoate-protein ligase B